MKLKLRRLNSLPLIISIVMLSILVIIFARSYTAGEIAKVEWYELSILAILVATNIVYVWLMQRSVRSTEEQVKEMKGQTLSMTMPVVLPECWSGQEGSSEGIFVALQNMGRGPALNIGCTIVVDEPEAVEDAWKKGTGAASVRAYFGLAELGMGENTAWHPQFVELGLHRNERFSVVVECHDVYENDIGTVRSYHVMWGASGQHELVLLGALGARRIDHRIRRWP